jgi:hypothetical protein
MRFMPSERLPERAGILPQRRRRASRFGLPRAQLRQSQATAQARNIATGKSTAVYQVVVIAVVIGPVLPEFRAMAVVLATPTGAKPHWMARRYPEIRRMHSPGGQVEPLREMQHSRHNHRAATVGPVFDLPPYGVAVLTAGRAP